MNRIDDNLTRRMQAWLSAPAGGRDFREGAEMLLRLTRNRILHANILRRPDKMAAKLEYELKKHLRIRLDGLTRRDVALMEREVMPRAEELLAAGGPPDAEDDLPEISSEADQPAPVHEGRRADHDALPEEIRRLWDDNADIWFRIKQTYNTLLSMEHAAPCDRYEYLKALDELDRRYRDNMARYDAYNPAAAGADVPDGGADCAAPTAAEVSAARKYLSTNRAKLEAAVAEGDDDKAGKIRESMQQRVDTVLRAGESFKQDYRDALAGLGLSME